MKTIAGKYRLIEKIGLGGMGEVYSAELTGADGFTKTVAIKGFGSALDPKQRDAISHEARILCEINHPNICSCLDFITEGDQQYLVLEYINGISLSDLLSRQAQKVKNLDDDFLIEIAWQILSALVHLHEPHPTSNRRIIHGDLSPQNIMITTDGVIKIIDFGISKAISFDRDFTKTLNQMGKLPYLAPEILLEQTYSPQTDLYALGIILFELATGRPPFESNSLAHLIEEIRSPKRKSLKKHRPDLNPDLSSLIEDCLQTDPTKRPKSADEAQRRLLPSRRPLMPRDLASRVVSLVGKSDRSDQTTRVPTPTGRSRPKQSLLLKVASLSILAAAALTALNVDQIKQLIFRQSAFFMSIEIIDKDGHSRDISPRERRGVTHWSENPASISSIACDIATGHILNRSALPWYPRAMEMYMAQTKVKSASEALYNLVTDFYADIGRVRMVLDTFCQNQPSATRTVSKLNEREVVIKEALTIGFQQAGPLSEWLIKKYPMEKINDDIWVPGMTKEYSISVMDKISLLSKMQSHNITGMRYAIYLAPSELLPKSDTECVAIAETLWLLYHGPASHSESDGAHSLPARILIMPAGSGEITHYDESGIGIQLQSAEPSPITSNGYCYYARDGLKDAYFDRLPGQ